jgi:hypothetical protein
MPATAIAAKNVDPDHPLVRWRKANGLTAVAFLERVKRHLPRGARLIDKSTFSRYESGAIRRPDPVFAEAVGKVTDGKVTYLQLCAPRQKRAR